LQCDIQEPPIAYIDQQGFSNGEHHCGLCVRWGRIQRGETSYHND
jgi:hypothetical protein